ncbi:hypothetical protein [Jeotgalibaca caeni]|uniref:hypothetical protein n=1 Tax=Jeotgalibaca caeni TaxID=3028623 RepID=UPI00237E7EA8|nr:hypothetical protein [Jeotgalibaca caeni]MDE1548157.1 hypothetical protein [Jeotgalibaca caeni]
MDSHTLVKEMKRLLRNQKKQFITFTFIFLTLLLLVQFIPLLIRYQAEQSEAQEETTSMSGTEKPAVFEMYIEYNDGGVYTNTLLLEEAIKTDTNIEAIEEATNVEISDLLDVEKETNYPKTARDRGVLGASRNEASNIWVFSSRVGTEEENVRVLQSVYEMIENGEISLLQNKNTYVISEPRILTEEELANPEALIEVEGSVDPFSIRNIAVSFIIAVIGGVAVAFFATLTLTFFSKKIKYAFNYNWNEEDTFVLLNSQDRDAIQHTSVVPASRERVLLAQDADKMKDTSGLRVSEHVLQLDNQLEVEEVVLFVQPNITDKTWYNQQRELLKLYHAPIKIIQLNEE